MKVLLSAYACEPRQGSEPGVGWNVVREIAKYHQVWVFTSIAHRSGIEAELTSNPLPNVHFVYLDPLGWTYDWTNQEKGVQWKLNLHYYLWQIRAYFVARSLHRQIGFDVIHHVTYVQYARPSFLSLLPLPFIWGPVGGGEFAPKAFWQDFSSYGKVYETLREMDRRLFERDPFVRLTARRSILSIATTEDTAERLRKMGARNVQVFSQVGLPEEEIACLAQHAISDGSPMRFVSMARLLHWKGFHLGLRAFAEANLPEAEYWILGDGPERERLQELAEKLGITNQVKFWGRLSRDETLFKLRECLALVHPSLHDSGGWVCLEAMAAGLPVICLDLGGPATQVTEETGFKIRAHTPEQAVCDLAEAIVRLVKDQGLRVRMGQAGQKRVREAYGWEIKGKFLVQLYEQILNQR